MNYSPGMLFSRLLGKALTRCRSRVADGASASGIAKQAATAKARLALFAGALLSSLFSSSPSATAATPMQEYVEAMQPGTNWGNTLDAIPNRYSWGAPETTQAMIQGLVDKGYKSIRIPITWSNYTSGAPDYTIDPAFMDHVEDVVDWSLDAGLYVMINQHHDSWTWLHYLPEDPEGTLDRFEKVWLQIANRFKDRSDKLMFESINEPGFVDANDKQLPDAEMAAILDEVNTTFVGLVRGTGDGNATRPLVLPTVYTRSDQPMMDSLKQTILDLNDPNLIATMHYYGWFPFSVNLGGYPKFDQTSIDWVHTPFDAMYDTFVADGIPVVIGEFSVLAGSTVQRGEQLKYHEYVQAYGRSKGMTMMLWDTGGIYGRNLADWNNADLGNIMMQAAVGRAITAESDLLFVEGGKPVLDTVVNMQLNGNTLVSVEDNGATLTPGADYTVSGEKLTLKAHVLSKYATGAFGQKATLKLHADAGPAWKIFVRYFETPEPSNVTAITGAAINIPVAFNGDLLATMESKYEDGSNAGPTNWTSFQQFNSAFHPDYANNAIVLHNDFLSKEKPGKVNFSFYFWSGKVLNYEIEIVQRSSEGGTEFVIYDDAIPNGWHDWNSWMAHNLSSTAQVYSGSKAISVTPSGWGGLTLQNGWGEAVDTSAFQTLSFWVHGGEVGGQSIGLHLIFGDDWNSSTWVGLPTLVANTWQKIEIPLSSLNAQGRSNITGVSFRHFSGNSGPTFHIDQIYLTTAKTTAVADVYGMPVPEASFNVKLSGFSYNRRTGMFTQSAIITNTGAEPTLGPVTLALNNLSLNTELLNAEGYTENVSPFHSPYITVSTEPMAPGAQIKVLLQFAKPSSGGITYQARVLSGVSLP